LPEGLLPEDKVLLAKVRAKGCCSVGEASEGVIKEASRTELMKENLKIYDKYYEIYGFFHFAIKSCFDKIADVIMKRQNMKCQSRVMNHSGEKPCPRGN
jgi:hypothetical protein